MTALPLLYQFKQTRYQFICENPPATRISISTSSKSICEGGCLVGNENENCVTADMLVVSSAMRERNNDFLIPFTLWFWHTSGITL